VSTIRKAAIIVAVLVAAWLVFFGLFVVACGTP
jgi:hypothetical protein